VFRTGQFRLSVPLSRILRVSLRRTLWVQIELEAQGDEETAG
jgi:hypothetical protein